MDLQKAQQACEQLSEQLMNAEAAKEKFEAEAKKFLSEAELARKAKEAALEERVEATKKHEVFSEIFLTKPFKHNYSVQNPSIFSGLKRLSS